jgi:dTDP-4-dehydrorhamnose reductase
MACIRAITDIGHALRQQVPAAGVELIATSRGGGDGLLALDLADASACRAMVQQLQPDWVLNSGEYTAVDQAESEPELAHAVNGGAPRAFAEALATSALGWANQAGGLAGCSAPEPIS